MPWRASAACSSTRSSAAIIEELATGRTHGGVLALVGPRRERSVGELIGEVGEGSLIVMLDGIEDPFNFGQAVRALYAAGIGGLVVRRSWETGAGDRDAGVGRGQRADADRTQRLGRGCGRSLSSRGVSGSHARWRRTMPPSWPRRT